jgi:hypothetical protein
MILKNIDANTTVFLAINDIVKFGTVFVTKEIVSAKLTNRPLNFGTRWQMESGFTILGYTIFDVLSSNLPSVGEAWQPIFNDVVKVTLGEITRDFMIQHTLTYENIISSLGLSLGIVIYHMLLKKTLFSNHEFGNDSSSLTRYALNLFKSKKD